MPLAACMPPCPSHASAASVASAASAASAASRTHVADVERLQRDQFDRYQHQLSQLQGVVPARHAPLSGGPTGQWQEQRRRQWQRLQQLHEQVERQLAAAVGESERGRG